MHEVNEQAMVMNNTSDSVVCIIKFRHNRGLPRER